jgi:NDP-sugar pyrophosphorylase family protein
MATWTSDLAFSRDLLADVRGHIHVNGNGRPHANGHDSLKDVKAVILAGGRGTRLAPYTSVLPKPLMPIGDRSILEVVVGQLEDAGIFDVHFCVGYLAHLIEAVFESRENGHVNITYVREQEALGTAGPLRLVDGLDSTFIVMNGDVLTTIDYEKLIRFHREQGNALTIATRERSIKIDYGLLHLDEGSRVQSYEEKPTISSRVSMGIYVMEPDVIELVPRGEFFDFPDLVRTLLAEGEPVGAYDHDGLWFDIGRQEDYERAIDIWLEDEHSNGNGNGNGSSQETNGIAAHSSNRNGSAAHRSNIRLPRLRRLRASD